MFLPKFHTFFVIILYFGLIETADNLRQLHIIFRHGERSPTETYPNDPHSQYKWPAGWGQLTNVGKLQMYTLGQRLKKHYKDFIPTYYFPENITFFSSYADRSLMSAQLVAAGLFPPTGEQIWNEDLLWQPLPIKYMPRSQDNFIAMKQNCKKYDKTYDEVLKSPKVTKTINDNKPLLETLSKHTGLQVNTLAQVETLFNTLEIERLNNLTLPSWVEEEMLVKMKQLGALNLALYSETDFMRRMKGGVWVKRVLDSMKKVLNNENEPQIYLYSGHDFSLVQILRTLNLVELYKPEFGAAVGVELNGNGIIKIYLWDRFDAEPKLQITSDIKNFESTYKQFLPINWITECQDD